MVCMHTLQLHTYLTKRRRRDEMRSKSSRRCRRRKRRRRRKRGRRRRKRWREQEKDGSPKCLDFIEKSLWGQGKTAPGLESSGLRIEYCTR